MKCTLPLVHREYRGADSLVLSLNSSPCAILKTHGLFLCFTIMKPNYKKLTTAQKYASLKQQTEKAGMTVKEKNGKLVVTRKSKKRK